MARTAPVPVSPRIEGPAAWFTEPVKRLTSEDELRAGSLSDHLGPFLPHFVREAVRSGGEAWVVREAERLAGLLLFDPFENAASLFTRSPPLVEAMLRHPIAAALYSEWPVEAARETYRVSAVDLEELPAHRFRHEVEAASPGGAEVRGLLREVYGRVNDRWLSGVPSPTETSFLARVGDEVVGAAWVAVLGRFARLHTLTVRPGFRGLGVGTDLLFARLLWARGHGASRALSEIAEGNVASLRVASRGGMRSVGEGFLYGTSEAANERGPGPGPHPG